MLRHSRLVMMVLIAMFIVAVPTALAQTPVADQYETVPPGGDTEPTDEGGMGPTDEGDAAPTDEGGGNAPVDVANASPADTDSLPFTGGQVSLIALIGLGLLALGVLGRAGTHRHGASPAS